MCELEQSKPFVLRLAKRMFQISSRKIIPALPLVFLFSFDFYHLQSATVTGFYLTLKLETTSDWTELKFDSVSSNFYLVKDTILGRLTDNYNYFSISRSDTAYSGMELVLFFPSFPQNDISITCTKGYWGVTTLTATIHCSTGDSSLSLQNTMVPGDPMYNSKVLTFPAAFIQCARTDTLLLREPAGCPKILAFYYPWYGSPSGPTGHWVHWDPGLPGYNAVNTPMLGYYDSYDYAIIARHIQWAEQNGIEGFICSWWGQGDFTDGATQRIFDVADTSSLSLSLYYEPADIGRLPVSQRVQRCIADLTYLVNTYGQRPAMLRHNGQPVLFIYGATLGLLDLSQWCQVVHAAALPGCILVADRFAPGILDLFDGWHTYNPVFMSFSELRNSNVFAGSHANLAGKIFASTAAPGFISVSRQNGYKYYQQLGASIAYKPHYILITSFNEWHEGTEIEPSSEYGLDYLTYTKEFRQYLDSACNAVTAVEESKHSRLFLSNYPNPFVCSTTIFFTLPIPQDAELDVRDAAGRKVSVLAKGKFDAGSHAFTYGGTHLQGGIYFCTLKTSADILVRKMILLR